MDFLHWLIVIIPIAAIIYMAFHSKRYVRDVSDYLACGRVAGRYVISVGDLTSGLSVITLVANCELNYQSGLAYSFWGGVTTVVGIIVSLTGYCVYRFRQTKCLSCGQFFEMRYNRPFRIVASTIRALAEMVTNAIGPAVAVRFFIYFLGLPLYFNFLGFRISTYVLLVAGLLILALMIIWPSGRISLLVTDAIQGILCYPVFVIFSVFLVCNISWFSDVVPAMCDRVPGQSFLNPYDTYELQNFNVFSTIVLLINAILNRAGWIGNDTTSAGRTPHEQKMGGVLGAVRNGYSNLMLTLLGVCVIAFMVGNRFESKAREIRIDDAHRVAQEVFDTNKVFNADIKAKMSMIPDQISNALSVENLPLPNHVIDTAKLFSKDKQESLEYRKKNSYSYDNNPDKPVLDAIKSTIAASGACANEDEVNAKFQEFKSLYFQMMMPTMLRKIFPQTLTALFTLLMLMLLLSTDDSRIFNASSSLIQDVILPFKKKPLTVEQHLKYLKVCTLLVAVFFFVVSLFFAQLDFIHMFTTAMCGVWLGASGPIMIGGLYTRFGNTCGAWCALIFGSGTSIFGLFCNRCWSQTVYPFLRDHDLLESVDSFLRWVSHPFNPWIDWKILEAYGGVGGEKFPINSYEVFFLSMVLGCAAYVVGSLICGKKAYNLDRLLHRGMYSETPEEDAALEAKVKAAKEEARRHNFVVRFFRWVGSIISAIVGITPEYSLGDKFIAWLVFGYSVIYAFVLAFVGVCVWNTFSPWRPEHWGIFYFVTVVAVPMSLGLVSTVWFMCGGIVDLIAMFRDLKNRVGNALDNGMVEGEVSLADKAKFDKLEHNNEQ